MNCLCRKATNMYDMIEVMKNLVEIAVKALHLYLQHLTFINTASDVNTQRSKSD